MMDLDLLENTISKTIMPNDHMYNSANPNHYFSVGQSALRAIEASLLLKHNRWEPENILDFGCGSGRVTRWLKAGFPEATITACDLRQDSLEFLQETLGVETCRSNEDFCQVAFPVKFDLIWCGSLVTHLSRSNTERFLQCCGSWLGEDGVAVVTFHGREVAARLRKPEQKYTNEKLAKQILREFEETSYGYANYPGREDIGLSICEPSWVLAAAHSLGFRVHALGESAWDNHQDLIAFSRR